MTINISDNLLYNIQSQGFTCERCKKFISPNVVIDENGIDINSVRYEVQRKGFNYDFIKHKAKNYYKEVICEDCFKVKDRNCIECKNFQSSMESCAKHPIFIWNITAPACGLFEEKQ